MKTNKKLMWVLGVLVLGVWGMIAHQIMSAVTTDDGGEASSQNTVEVHDRDDSQQFVYDDAVRDPFRFIIANATVRKDTTRRNAKPLPAWTPPPLKLAGILLDKKKRTAMLEGNDGTILFVHEGDTLKGTKVLKIGEQTVSYLYQKQKSEWGLAR